MGMHLPAGFRRLLRELRHHGRDDRRGTRTHPISGALLVLPPDLLVQVEGGNPGDSGLNLFLPTSTVKSLSTVSWLSS